MIKSNELSVGNYVLLKSNYEYQKNEIVKLLSIDENDGCYYNVATNKKTVNKKYKKNKNGWCVYQIIQPIPLNAEILKKLGFEDDDCLIDYVFSEKLETVTNVLGYCLKTKKAHFYQFRPDNTLTNSSGVNLCKIEYVHELQNLFFLIFKKELTF